MSKETTIEYSSNNSGGYWWLSDDDWRNLESAGWIVDWVRDSPYPFMKGERFLGALATSATASVFLDPKRWRNGNPLPV